MEPNSPDPELVADQIHSAAIHVLRSVRGEDVASGTTPARLSALSVVVFAGPVTVGRLAAAEQVSVPTISRMVSSMVEDGLVRREVDPEDRRVTWLEATPEGTRLLQKARRRRVRALARALESLSPTQLKQLVRAAGILERLAAEVGDA